MNIFFKLLAVLGLGGTIGGATYLSRQEYTTYLSSTNPKKKPKKKEGKTIDIKRQPTIGEQQTVTEDDEDGDDEDQEEDSRGGGHQIVSNKDQRRNNNPESESSKRKR